MENTVRKSYTALNKIYFWTATIHNWLHLLHPTTNKQLIVDCLKHLSDRGLITVYAFVIMPNHIHLIWRQNELNGKETPKGALLKYTAHIFRKELIAKNKLHHFAETAANKKSEIWQRDSLGIEIFSREVAKQKLDYIHFNPVSGKWSLSKDDLSYYFRLPGFMKQVLTSLVFYIICMNYLTVCNWRLVRETRTKA